MDFPVQSDPKTGGLEGLVHEFNLSEAMATREQVILLVSCGMKASKILIYLHVQLESATL